MLKKIAALVQGQGHCVLATSQGDRPHASLMSFRASPDCREFWLVSLEDSRKLRNLRANPRASLLLDDRSGCVSAEPSQALTVEAEARPFASEAQAAAARAALLARHPRLEGFLALEGAVLLRFVALRFQMLTGLQEVFAADAEKVLDAGEGKA